MIKKAISFITSDIWRIRSRNLPKRKHLLIKNLRIALLAWRGFDEDKCQLRASALTYYSLLAIVPVVAMAFGVAKGFGFETMLETHLLDKFPGQEEIFVQVIGFANALLEKTKGGVVAGLGVASTLITLIYQRQKDMGLLSLVGATCRQVRQMIVFEAVILGGVSQLIGIFVGTLLALVLIYVINVQSFGWTIQLHLPIQFMVQSTVLVLAASGLFGLYPAIRATGLDALRTVREEHV